MATKDLKTQFIDYCYKNWDLPDYEVEKALDLMNMYRCPLDFANDTVSDHIRDLADEFERENDLDDNWYFDTFDNDEDVFFKLNIFGDK